MSRLARTPRGLAALGLTLVAMSLAACSQDDIAGPAKQVGPPLLDITIGPSSAAVFPSGSFTLNATRDTLSVALANLPPLPAGSHYQVFLVDSASNGAGSNLLPAVGRLITTRTTSRPVNRDSAFVSTVVDTVTGATVIDSVGSSRALNFRITNSDLAGKTIASFSHVVVAVVQNTATNVGNLVATDRKGFLWARYRNAGVTPNTFTTSGSLTFGSFAINTANRLNFTVQGTADAAFWGDAIRANFTNLTRPPEGFQYAGWLIDDRTGTQKRIGVLQTPVPDDSPLSNADVGTGPFLTAGSIFRSQIRAAVDSADNFTRFVLVLEPKGATGGPSLAPTTEVMSGDVPAAVASRHPGAGSISGTVTKAGANAVGAAVYLSPVGSTRSLLATSTDANGHYLFRTVQVGTYSLNVIPAGDTQIRFTQTVTVGRTTNASNEPVGETKTVNVTLP